MLNFIKRFLSIDKLEEEIEELKKEVKVLSSVYDERDSLWFMIDEQKSMEEAMYEKAEEYENDLMKLIFEENNFVGEA